jgi:hypothetical protein
VRWLRPCQRSEARPPSLGQYFAGGFCSAQVGSSFPLETITPSPYLPSDDGRLVELPRMPLPRSVGNVEGGPDIAIDLVRRRIAWFADYGSTPLIVPLSTGS